MKNIIVSVAVVCVSLMGAAVAQAQYLPGPGGHRQGSYGHGGHTQPLPTFPGSYRGSIGASYYGGNVHGGSYARPSHYDYVPGHFDFGRGYVPAHVDLHIGGRRYDVLPGGYVSPYHHHRD